MPAGQCVPQIVPRHLVTPHCRVNDDIPVGVKERKAGAVGALHLVGVKDERAGDVLSALPLDPEAVSVTVESADDGVPVLVLGRVGYAFFYGEYYFILLRIPASTTHPNQDDHSKCMQTP